MQGSITRKIKEIIVVWRVGALPGIAVIGLVIIARLAGLLQSLECSILDSFLRLRPEEPLDQRIVIVGINEADIRSVGTYPIPDQEIAALIRRLQTYQPRVIGLDIVRDLPVKPGHAELVAVFKTIKNLIAIEKVLPDQIAPPPDLPSKQVGFSDAMLDADGHLRRSLLGTPNTKNLKQYKFSLSVRLAEAYLSTQGISLENGIRDRNTMRFGKTELPQLLPNSGGYVGADAGGVQVLLNFRSNRAGFQILSLNDIKIGNFDPKSLRDRIVIIGITSPGVDIVTTSAIAGEHPGRAYGVEIQAHTVSQIVSAVLDGRPLLRVWSNGWEYLWIVGWGILGVSLGQLTQSPTKNLLGVGVVSMTLLGCCFILLLLGWWVPVAPTFLVLVLNGFGLTALYQYDWALRSRISDRQLLIDRTFDTIHNGPLQTLAKLLKSVREQDLPSNQLIEELEHLNHELRAIYEFMQRETITLCDSFYLKSGLELNLQVPVHEILYQVYSYTLERDLPCFKTLKVKVCTFDPINDRHLSIEQKRALCRFLEEALCNAGKHAKGVTRLVVTLTQQENWCILSITDNGKGICSNFEGRGTQQCRNLARRLRGKFQRTVLFPKGTVCELTWCVKKL